MRKQVVDAVRDLKRRKHTRLHGADKLMAQKRRQIEVGGVSQSLSISMLQQYSTPKNRTCIPVLFTDQPLNAILIRLDETTADVKVAKLGESR